MTSPIYDFWAPLLQPADYDRWKLSSPEDEVEPDSPEEEEEARDD